MQIVRDRIFLSREGMSCLISSSAYFPKTFPFLHPFHISLICSLFIKEFTQLISFRIWWMRAAAAFIGSGLFLFLGHWIVHCSMPLKESSYSRFLLLPTPVPFSRSSVPFLHLLQLCFKIAKSHLLLRNTFLPVLFACSHQIVPGLFQLM